MYLLYYIMKPLVGIDDTTKHPESRYAPSAHAQTFPRAITTYFGLPPVNMDIQNPTFNIDSVSKLSNQLCLSQK